MALTNVSKPSSTLANTDKVSSALTWATITTTWANETRNWLQTATTITNEYNTPANTYTVSATTFAPRTLTGAATSLTLTDDDTEEVSLPFLFNFFGVQYRTVVVSSNGFLSFFFNSATSFNPGTIPYSGANKPNATIYGYWYDFDPAQAGTIKYETFGSAGSRVFVVEYAGIRGFAEPTTNFTFQIMLYEADNSIEIHTTSSTNVAGLATQGIENQEGTVAYYLAGRNYESLTLTNDAVRFARTSLLTNTSRP